MPSSRNTTDFPSAEEIMATMGRRLKRAAAASSQRKLESGEYAMYEGNLIPVESVPEIEEPVIEANAQRKAKRFLIEGYLEAAHDHVRRFIPLPAPKSSRVNAFYRAAFVAARPVKDRRIIINTSRPPHIRDANYVGSATKPITPGEIHSEASEAALEGSTHRIAASLKKLK